MERSAQRKNTDELLVAASFFIFFARFDSDVTVMYRSNGNFNIPPGQPPGHLNF